MVIKPPLAVTPLHRTAEGLITPSSILGSEKSGCERRQRLPCGVCAPRAKSLELKAAQLSTPQGIRRTEYFSSTLALSPASREAAVPGRVKGSISTPGPHKKVVLCFIPSAPHAPAKLDCRHTARRAIKC